MSARGELGVGQRGRHRVLADLDARAAERTGTVACLDGTTQHAFRTLVRVGGQRHTDARGDLRDAGDDHRRVRDTHRDALRQRLGRRVVGDVTTHEHEPFLVDVRDHVARVASPNAGAG